MEPCLHLAKIIITNKHEPVIHGGLLIENSKVTKVGKKEEFGNIENTKIKIKDHGNSLICPGFINLHCHLLYSSIEKINSSDGLFPWLEMLVESKNKMTELDLKDSVQKGINEALQTGTTFLVENSPNPRASFEVISKSPLKALIGIEVFGSEEDKAEEIFEKSTENLNSLSAISSQSLGQNIEFTFSPHAPYDVSKGLWKKLINWAEENKKPLLTHLEESSQEKLWWQKKSGPAISFWKRINKLEPKIKYWEKYNSGIDFLYRNNIFTDNFIASHITQADNEELKILKNQNIKLVHCPRSNHYLNSGTANLRLWDELNLLWGLGTDSLASNNNLSMLSELKSCLEMQERVYNYKIPSKQAFLAITLNASKVLSKQNEIGALKEGFLADFLVIDIKDTDEYIYNDPYYTLIWETDYKKSLKEVWINGKNIYKKNELLHKI